MKNQCKCDPTRLAPIKFRPSVKYKGTAVWAMLDFDPEVNRWLIVESNVPGLVMEADTPDELKEWLPDVVSTLERLCGG